MVWRKMAGFRPYSRGFWVVWGQKRGKRTSLARLPRFDLRSHGKPAAAQFTEAIHQFSGVLLGELPGLGGQLLQASG